MERRKEELRKLGSKERLDERASVQREASVRVGWEGQPVF